jgi:hypothetical protein
MNALLAVTIVLGSAFLWMGIPLLGFWVAGQLATTTEGFLLVAVVAIPTAMAGFGWVLYRVNRIYEGGRDPEQPNPSRAAWLVSSSEGARTNRARRPGSLIDFAMTASVLAALTLLVVWFFVVAESPNCCSW